MIFLIFNSYTQKLVNTKIFTNPRKSILLCYLPGNAFKGTNFADEILYNKPSTRFIPPYSLLKGVILFTLSSEILRARN